MSIDNQDLVAERRVRLDAVLDHHGVVALLTCDPVSIRYATGTRNMLVHGMTGPDRFALIVAHGPAVLWEFAGCGHVSADAPFVDEVRDAPGITMKKTVDHRTEIHRFGAEVIELCRQLGPRAPVAVEGLGWALVDRLRERGLTICDGVAVTQLAMAIKQPAEIDAMFAAVAMTQTAAEAMEEAIAPGRTEQEVWAEFHRVLIAEGGELVVTRLLQAGERTFPYFQEASANELRAGDLVCFDSDAVGLGGYSVDFSRTFPCGDAPPTDTQIDLYRLAVDQLEHNAANLAPGRSFEDFARAAFDVPEPYAHHGYYQLAHGLGMLGGYPNIPRLEDGPYRLPGRMEPGMVICVESYIGDPDTHQGVKLENQYLIGDETVEQMTTYPLDPALQGIAPGAARGTSPRPLG